MTDDEVPMPDLDHLDYKTSNAESVWRVFARYVREQVRVTNPDVTKNVIDESDEYREQVLRHDLLPKLRRVGVAENIIETEQKIRAEEDGGDKRLVHTIEWIGDTR